jgi:hypothetical protein
MAQSEGIISRDVRETVVRGQKIYDIEGKQTGTVDTVDREAGTSPPKRTRSRRSASISPSA